MFIVSIMGGKLNTNNCKSNVLAIALAETILVGLSNINTTWCSAHTCHWISQATDFWTHQMNTSQVGIDVSA